LRATRALDMDCRALDDPLESGRGCGFGAVDIRDQSVELLVEESDDRPAQLFQLDAAGLHHAGSIRLIQQRKQKMLERGEFVLARVGMPKGVVNCGFEGA